MVTLKTSDIIAAASVSVRSEIWKFLQEQRLDGSLCDAVIECGDSKFMAHRFVLAAVSPYFKAHILGSFHNMTKNGMLHLTLNDFSVTSVQLFLDLVYEETNVKDASIDIADFLELLDFLQLDVYYNTVLEVLRPKVTLDNCLVLFSVSRRYNAKMITKLLATYIGAHISELIAGEYFYHMPLEDFQALVKCVVVKSLPGIFLEKAYNCLKSSKHLELTHTSCIEQYSNPKLQPHPIEDEKNIIIMYCLVESYKAQVVGTEHVSNLDFVFPIIFKNNGVREYFIYRGQLYAVGNSMFNPDITIDRYDQMTKNYIEVFREKNPDVSSIMGVFPDLEQNFVYLIYQTSERLERDLEDIDEDEEIEFLTDLHILKIDIDEGFVVDKLVHTDEIAYDMSLASVCYNARENCLYIINYFKYSIYKLNQKQIDSVSSLIMPSIFDGVIIQTSIVHFNSIYYFQVNEEDYSQMLARNRNEKLRKLTISKSGPLEMEFTSIFQMDIHHQISFLKCVPLSSRCLLLFALVQTGRYMVYEWDCVNEQLTEVNKWLPYEGDRGRDFISVPSYIFE